jgi:2-polyprenyl-3-methyl-5-hydroxy-6-metoxy-1,4-benzoquinol methylase
MIFMREKIVHIYFSKKPEIENSEQYERATVQSSNPLVRIAHRSRIKKCVELAAPRLEIGKVLDYGCGTGLLVSILNKIKPGCAVGYEPFRTERFEKDTSVFSQYADIERRAPYSTITLFEVIEHLNNESIKEFLDRSEKLFNGGGGGWYNLHKRSNRNRTRGYRKRNISKHTLETVFLRIP